MRPAAPARQRGRPRAYRAPAPPPEPPPDEGIFYRLDYLVESAGLEDEDLKVRDFLIRSRVLYRRAGRLLFFRREDFERAVRRLGLGG